MEKVSSRNSNLSATLWSLVFATCLVLAAAHLAMSTRDQASQEPRIISTTFTQAPATR